MGVVVHGDSESAIERSGERRRGQFRQFFMFCSKSMTSQMETTSGCSCSWRFRICYRGVSGRPWRVSFSDFTSWHLRRSWASGIGLSGTGTSGTGPRNRTGGTGTVLSQQPNRNEPNRTQSIGRLGHVTRNEHVTMNE